MGWLAYQIQRFVRGSELVYHSLSIDFVEGSEATHLEYIYMYMIYVTIILINIVIILLIKKNSTNNEIIIIMMMINYVGVEIDWVYHRKLRK